MPQSVTTVTNEAPSPPTNLGGQVGMRPPTTPGLVPIDDGAAGDPTLFAAPVSGGLNEAAGTEVVVIAPGSRPPCPTLAVSVLGNYSYSPNTDHPSSGGVHTTMTHMVPETSVLGTPPDALTVHGTGFTPKTVIEIDDHPQVTVFVSDTEVYTRAASLRVSRALGEAGPVPVWTNTEGHLSNSLDFIVAEVAAPVLDSLAPNSAVGNGLPVTLSCIGSHFNSTSVIWVNGVAQVTTHISPTEITATLPARTSNGAWPVLVRAPDFPDSATINWNFITTPLITSYGPNPGPVGPGTFGFSLTGNFFAEGMWVYFDDVPTIITDVYSQWSMTGTAQMPTAPKTSVFKLMYNGIVCITFDWAFTGPVLSSIAPNPTPAGAGPILLTCTGLYFNAGSVIYVNSAAVPTTYVSATSLTATVDARPDAGTWPVYVVTDIIAEGATPHSITYTETIDWVFDAAAPTLTSLQPNPAEVAIGIGNVTCEGTGFTTASKVYMDGSLAAGTQFNSATSLAGLFDPGPAVGNHPVVVRTANSPDTAAIDWVITAPSPPNPTLTSVAPNPCTALVPFTLGAFGANFTASSVIVLNDGPCATTFISPTNIEASSVMPLSGTRPVLVRTGSHDTAPIDMVFQASPPIT